MIKININLLFNLSFFCLLLLFQYIGCCQSLGNPYKFMQFHMLQIQSLNSLHNFGRIFFPLCERNAKICFFIYAAIIARFCYVTLIHPWGTEFPLMHRVFTWPFPHGLEILIPSCPSNPVFEGWAHGVISRGKLCYRHICDIFSVSFSGHIMISYQWANQEIMLKVRDFLKQQGFEVWMDVEDMCE